MELRPLGRTGLSVSCLGLGTMMFGRWGNTDRRECFRIVHAAVDAGVNLVDTADVYGAGDSEETLGASLGNRRDQVLLATKVGRSAIGTPPKGGASKRWIVTALDASLRRLRTDHVDLYFVHRPDPTTPIEETLLTLTDLVRAGKVRFAACSRFDPAAIVESHWAAERHGCEPFVCEQPTYSLMAREAERELFPVCQKYGMGVLVASPLSGGWLTAKHTPSIRVASVRRALLPQAFDPCDDQNLGRVAVVDGVSRIAHEVGLSPIELALAWTLQHPAVTATLIGPRTLEQLEENLAVAEVRLRWPVLDELDELVAPGTNVEGRAAEMPPSLVPHNRRRCTPTEEAVTC